MNDGAARALATIGGLGDRIPAPGTTVGSLVALLAFVALARALPVAAPAAALVGLAALAPLAVWACGVEAARRGGGDPGAIVLDETAGQWLALTLATVAAARPLTLAGALLSFALFRLLDIGKPWPIRRLERLPGGWGIVADDLAAGAVAAVVQVLAMRLVSSA